MFIERFISKLYKYSLIIIIFSCSSNIDPYDKNPYNFEKQTSMEYRNTGSFGDYYSWSYDGYLFLVIRKRIEIMGKPTFQILANCRRGYGGDAIISDMRIKRKEQGYELHYPTPFDSTAENMPSFGKVGHWEFGGNSKINFEPFSKDFYVPNILEFKNGELGYFNEISVSKGVNIEWIADENNEDGIWLWFWYDAEQSMRKDSTLQAEEFCWYKKVDDDGFYHLNLNRFDIPTTGFVEIEAIRFVENMYITGDDTIIVRAETQAMAWNKLVP